MDWNQNGSVWGPLAVQTVMTILMKQHPVMHLVLCCEVSLSPLPAERLRVGAVELFASKAKLFPPRLSRQLIKDRRETTTRQLTCQQSQLGAEPVGRL